jgi:hypothetical protein
MRTPCSNLAAAAAKRCGCSAAHPCSPSVSHVLSSTGAVAGLLHRAVGQLWPRNLRRRAHPLPHRLPLPGEALALMYEQSRCRPPVCVLRMMPPVAVGSDTRYVRAATVRHCLRAARVACCLRRPVSLCLMHFGLCARCACVFAFVNAGAAGGHGQAHPPGRARGHWCVRTHMHPCTT